MANEKGYYYEFKKELNLTIYELSDYSKIGWELVSTYNVKNDVAYVLRKKILINTPFNEKFIENELFLSRLKK